MRKVLVAAVLVLALSVGAFAFQNEPDGFRGILWGDPVQEGMVLDIQLTEFFQSFNVLKSFYSRPEDNLKIGDVDLTKISYEYFYMGEGVPIQFGSVYIEYQDIQNYLSLRNICEQRFGVFDIIKYYDEDNPLRYKWESEQVYIALDYDIVKARGSLSILSIPMVNENTRLEFLEKGKSAEGDW